MAKKRTGGAVSKVPSATTTTGLEAPIEGGLPSPIDFSSVLQSTDLTLAEKRRKILEELGLKGKRKKYASKEERKAAAKKRRDERRATRAEVYKKYGVEPSRRGQKQSPGERKKKRSERAKAKRSFLREMAKSNPALAKQYGIDPTRFKL